MEQAQEIKTFTPKELATRLGVSPKRARMYLRTHYPRDIKHKNWQLTPQQAKKIVKDYKAEVKQREAKKQAQVSKELEGKEWQ